MVGESAWRAAIGLRTKAKRWAGFQRWTKRRLRLRATYEQRQIHHLQQPAAAACAPVHRAGVVGHFYGRGRRITGAGWGNCGGSESIADPVAIQGAAQFYAAGTG